MDNQVPVTRCDTCMRSSRGTGTLQIPKYREVMQCNPVGIVESSSSVAIPLKCTEVDLSLRTQA